MRLEDMGLGPDHRILQRDTVDAQRAALFQETAVERLQRWILGTAWVLRPSRLAGLPALGHLWLAELAQPTPALPNPADALGNPPGLGGFVQGLPARPLVQAHHPAI